MSTSREKRQAIYDKAMALHDAALEHKEFNQAGRALEVALGTQTSLVAPEGAVGNAFRAVAESLVRRNRDPIADDVAEALVDVANEIDPRS